MSNGSLYVVATPIGNLDDISHRAIEVLREVDLVAAEDSRHSRKLLQYLDIQQQMVSLHEHNEEKQVASLIEKLERGQDIALISDAGTPLISDPGYRLVLAAHEQGISVVSIPGPCAVIAALSIAGLPSDRFLFAGFLPVKSTQRQNALQQLADEAATLIFYEAPHRILKLLDDIKSVLGEERLIVLARELTKQFETVIRGNAENVINTLIKDPNQQKGEFVVLVQGCRSTKNISGDIEEKYLQLIDELIDVMPIKQIAKIIVGLCNVSRNTAYDIVQQRKQK